MLHSITFRSAVVCAAAVFATISTSQAQVFTDDFTAGNDDNWNRLDPIQTGSWSFPTDAYRIQSAPSPSPGTVGPGRAGSLVDNFTLSDFHIEFDLVTFDGDLENQVMGGLARVSDPGAASTSGYGLIYNHRNNTLNLLEITNEVSATLDSTSITLDPTESYRFAFTGVGDSLSGSIFNVGDLDNPMATVTDTDSTHSSGQVGLFVFDDSATADQAADATFTNYQAAIPEPSSLLLIVLAGGLGIFLRRRGWAAAHSTPRKER